MLPHFRALPFITLLCACAEPLIPVGGGAVGESALVVDIPPVRGTAVDLLFVIDNSETMLERQSGLTSTFKRMVDHLSFVPGGLPDLHIGVVSTDLGIGTDTWSVSGCDVNGDQALLQGQPRLPGCLPPGDAFLRDYRDGDQRLTNYAADQLQDAFACISQLSTDGFGCNYEQPLEVMRRAIDRSVTAGDGFVRPEALLGVVILTDEDDCSVKNTEFFDPALDTSGQLSKFRCFEKGVVCGGDDVRREGEFEGCVPNEQSEYLHGTAEYAAFLDDVKPDPTQVVVAGMIGASSLVEVEVTLDDQPQVVPACTDSDGAAYPAVRLQHFLEESRQQGEVSSLCDGGEPLDALSAYARRLRKALGTACLDGNLIDVDDEAPGLQFSCTVWDRYPDGDTVELPACADPYMPATSDLVPCYAIKTGPEACGDFRPHQLALQVWRGAWDAGQPEGVHTLGECLVDAD